MYYIGMAFLSRKTHNSGASLEVTEHTEVVIRDITVSAEVVSTTELINKGLSHRDNLPASEGMLFLFDHDAIFRFWMRGMRFPLDIIWIDKSKKIADISKNLQPVGLFGKPVFYSPSIPARYVLEVNAGFCDSHGISVGDAAQFSASL